MPASNVTLTPVYVDYSNGSTWASLGGSQAAYVAAVQQVFTDVGKAMYFPFGAKEYKYQVGLGAFGLFSADTTGQSLGSGAAGNANYFNGSPNYATYRSKLIAISSKNSLQQVAFNLTNLPVSNPVSSSTFNIAGFLEEVLGLDNTAPSGVIAGSIGFKSTSYTDTDQHGLGAGPNVYEGVFHELSECMGRSSNSELWWWGSAGVRQTDGTQAHYLSYDQGSLASKIYDLGLASGGDVFDVINAQTAFSQAKLNGAVCRDASTPGFAADWQYMTTTGFILSDSGLSWAGLSLPPAYSFSFGLKR